MNKARVPSSTWGFPAPVTLMACKWLLQPADAPNADISAGHSGGHQNPLRPDGVWEAVHAAKTQNENIHIWGPKMKS